jgi:hypothetical protein
LKPKVDAQAALAAFKTKSLSKRNKSTNAKLQTFFMAAVLVLLLTSSYFLFSTTLNLTKPELHKQNVRLPDNPKFY